MKFKILGKPWTLKQVNKKQYKKKHGTGSVAVTYVNQREIYLSPEGNDKETIVHELVHAYLSELCLHSSDLDDDSLEEVFAELMSKFGNELLNLASDIYWTLHRD